MKRYLRDAEVNKSIAHVEHEGKFFQVLNEAGDDWDEQATNEMMKNYEATKFTTAIKGFFGFKEE